METDETLARLINEYGDALYRLCVLYLRDVHLAEDAAQETLLRAYRGYSAFEGRSEEKTWLLAIAANVCRNLLRSQWFRRVDAETLLESIPAPPQAEPGDETLTRMVLGLPDKYREVVLLFYYEELKIREIAEALQLREGTVASRLRRARDKLKIELKGAGYDERNAFEIGS